MPELAVEHAIEVGVVSMPRTGERVNGDLAIVERLPAGTLLAVADGAGHGPEAHRAAAAATQAIWRSASEDLAAVMACCHEALAGTRGAAVTLALLSTARRTLTWLGVGTVEGQLLNARRWPADARASLTLPSGTIGHDLPRLAPVRLALEHGDLVVLATDGVRSRFGDVLDARGSAHAISQRLLTAHGRGTDDALVAVARYVETCR